MYPQSMQVMLLLKPTKPSHVSQTNSLSRDEYTTPEPLLDILYDVDSRLWPRSQLVAPNPDSSKCLQIVPGFILDRALDTRHASQQVHRPQSHHHLES